MLRQITTAIGPHTINQSVVDSITVAVYDIVILAVIYTHIEHKLVWSLYHYEIMIKRWLLQILELQNER
jgi:hypothetical protein